MVAVKEKKAVAKNRISGNGHRIAKDEEQDVSLPKGRKGRTSAPTITIPALARQTVVMTLSGITSLITNRFTAKAAEAIARNQAHEPRGKKEKRNPRQEYLDSVYLISGKAGEKNAVYGIPAVAVKKALIAACRYVDGIPMVVMKGVCHVIADDPKTGLLKLSFKSMNMREDGVVLKNGSMDLRYRAEFHDWSISPTIVYNSNRISAEQLGHLLCHAGFGVGLCELRPEKSGHDNGLFDLTGMKMPKQ